jgi:Domain of Unknown Function with PDB structure (DUF3857)/Domain of Unknown Function with PDB structure (DUF3858)
MFIKYCVLPILILLHLHTTAQNSYAIVYGEVSLADFNLKNYAQIDTNVAAIILADIGSTTIEGYEYGFRKVYTRTKRMLLLHKSAFEAGQIEISYSTEDNGKGKLKSLKAATYHIENGQVISEAVKEEDFHLKKNPQDINDESFAFPNLKEGTIIEYTFTTKSHGYRFVRPWLFQTKYPTVLSAYTLKLPVNINYATTLQGNIPLYKLLRDSMDQKIVAGNTWYDTQVQQFTWVMKDVPPLKEAAFITTLDNYVSRVSFQLSRFSSSALSSVNYLQSWQEVSNILLNSKNFGLPIINKTNWLKNIVNENTNSAMPPIEKAKKIFNFIRDNIATTENSVFINEDVALEDIYKKKAGTVAEKNLLLAAVLNNANIEATPIILSTRNNGYTNATYPVLENFNYIICTITIAGIKYFLDAAVPKIGFNKLPLYCYNGHAQAITKNTYPIYLSTDSLKEEENSSVFLYNDSNNKITATYSFEPGYYNSLLIRNKLDSATIDNYFKKEIITTDAEMDIKNVTIDSLMNYNTPIKINVDFSIKLDNNDVIYFNPMLDKSMLKNPFNSDSTRAYPIEMPYTIDKFYVLNMEIPNSYKVEDLPKSLKVALNNTDGFFEYRVTTDGKSIFFKSRIKIKKANFNQADYALLYDFYSYIAKKHAEFIVFKKI